MKGKEKKPSVMKKRKRKQIYLQLYNETKPEDGKNYVFNM